MAGGERVTIEEVVREVLRDEHADVIRESVRVAHRNGYRAPALGHAGRGDRAADPQDPTGLVIPSILQPWKRLSRRWYPWSSRRMCAASRRARVDQLVESLGLRISESEVSRIAGLDEQVTAFRERPLEGR
jgi:putative transposase